MINKLNNGGIASIQLTYAKQKRFLANEATKSGYYRRDGTTINDLIDFAPDYPEGTITMYDYDLNQVMSQIYDFATHPILILPTNMGGHIGVHIIFQRKN